MQSEPGLAPEHLAAANPASSRLVIVDVARVLAILFMIQGHALDVLLAPTYRQGAVFGVWLFLRGLTAPVFFTLSGVSFTLSTIRNWEHYSRPSKKLLRRLARFSFFVLLGYAMHLPAASLHDFQYVDTAGWQGWFQVDVLQCIGFTLISLQILVLLAAAPRRLPYWAGGLGAGIILATPLTWTSEWMHHSPLVLASYLNGLSGSIFPLFPWAGFVYCGAALGYALRKWSDQKSSAAVPLLATGLALGLSGLLLIKPLHAVYTALDFWTTSPSFFLIRLGCVCLLLALFSWVTARWNLPHHACRSLAQESLLIYFVHICILYGSIWNVGLRQLVGSTLAPLPTLGWIIALTATMVILGWGWNWLKRTEPRPSYLLRFAVLLLAVFHPWF
jgi:uncharacterized membrane protein